MHAAPKLTVPATQLTDVLVVGAGPAGLAVAVGLAGQGVSTVVVDKRGASSGVAGATGLSARTMEVLRSWGLEGRVRDAAIDALPFGRVADSLVDGDGAVVPAGFPGHDATRHLSPTPSVVESQDAFEAALLEQLSTYGTDVRLGTRLVSLRQDEQGVTAWLRHRTSRRRVRVRSRFVVGADGAGSLVRAQLGVPMHGPDHLEPYVGVVFRAPLGARVGRPRYAVTTVHGPEGTSLLLPVDGQDRWLLVQPWETASGRPADHTRGRMAALVRAAAGVADLDVEVESVAASWYAAQVAERYRVARAFLVGDAAHRSTPRGGNGIDLAVADAHNLAWKLGFVLRGWAGDELLDTYEAERRPVGEAAAARSLHGPADGPADDGTHGVAADLGDAYARGAMVDPGDADDADRDPAGGHRDRPRPQSARPGARAPHLWLGREGDHVSTLDLFGDGLAVVTGPDGSAWRRAAAELAGEVAVPLRATTIGGAQGLRDARGAFAQTYGIEPDGAVLVRPDGHVAWRSASTGGVDVLGELRRGVRAATGERAGERRLVRTVA